MKFLDEAKIYVKSGDGGGGCIAFRREKYVEFGGPNGGDGGRGGHVVVEAVPGLNTLIDFRYAQHHKGKRGNHGMGSDRAGGAGADCIIKVPAGTQILDESREHIIADMKKEGDRIVLARGGDGGLGNARFKTPTNRAPRVAGEGHPGEELWVWLRLKLFADAGLVGLPNAGKSTFLSKVSAARPKIADYPFTTLHPQLGVVQVGTQNFVLADLPGLIQGASDGAGIGTRFLGHIERCGAMIHLIDGTQEDIVGAYKTIREELEAYGGGLAEKQEVVVLNKIDALTDSERKSKLKELQLVAGMKPMEISGVSGEGVSKLLHRTWDMVQEDRLEKDPNPPVWQPAL